MEVDEEEEVAILEKAGRKKKYCLKCGRDHHSLQFPRYFRKEKEKCDSHASFDDESAFISHNIGTKTYMFNVAQEVVYFKDEMSEIHNEYGDSSAPHVVFPFSIFNSRCNERTDLDFLFFAYNVVTL